MNNDLQNTLYKLAQSGLSDNPAYSALLQDYTKYHAVLFIEGSIFMLLFVMLSIYFWRKFMKLPKSNFRKWSFEKKAYFGFGLGSIVMFLFMLLIVMANLSNVLNPQDGFKQTIPDIAVPQAGTQKALIYHAVNLWAKSGNDQMPSILQNEIKKRLSWQIPKAIICSVLLVVFFAFTNYIWQRLISFSQTSNPIWGRKEKVLIATGIVNISITLLLMLMALANTQASFAPITLTLLFS